MSTFESHVREGTENYLKRMKQQYEQDKAETEEIKDDLQQIIDEIAAVMESDGVSEAEKKLISEQSSFRIKRIRGKIMIAEAALEGLEFEIRNLSEKLD